MKRGAAKLWRKRCTRCVVRGRGSSLLKYLLLQSRRAYGNEWSILHDTWRSRMLFLFSLVIQLISASEPRNPFTTIRCLRVINIPQQQGRSSVSHPDKFTKLSLVQVLKQIPITQSHGRSRVLAALVVGRLEARPTLWPAYYN